MNKKYKSSSIIWLATILIKGKIVQSEKRSILLSLTKHNYGLGIIRDKRIISGL